MNQTKPKIYGHRGAAGLEFENTLASIQKAIDLGVAGIEIDVWQTTDGEVVVFHDASLNRLTASTGFIYEKSLKDLHQIPLLNGAPIPTLKEVIELVKPTKIPLLVEVKHEKAMAETCHILQASLPFSAFTIGSFYHEPIRALKKEIPGLQTAIMLEGVLADLPLYLKMVNPDFLVLAIESFNQEVLETMKMQNRKLLFYTVNTPAQIQLAEKAAPYGIITNYPDALLKHFGKSM